MRSKGVNLSPTGRRPRRRHSRCRHGRKYRPGHKAEAAAPELVYVTPYKVLHNPINQLRRDPNLDSTIYTITKIKT